MIDGAGDRDALKGNFFMTKGHFGLGMFVKENIMEILDTLEELGFTNSDKIFNFTFRKIKIFSSFKVIFEGLLGGDFLISNHLKTLMDKITLFDIYYVFNTAWCAD